MAHPEFVTIAYWAEFRQTDGSEESTDRIPWDEWAAMTERERQAVIDSYAEALASYSGGYCGEVRGDEPPPAPEPPAMPGLVALAAEAAKERGLHYHQIVRHFGRPDDEAAARIDFAEMWAKGHPAMAALIAHVEATTKGAAT